ncbi:MAG: outer membrane beta-barrel protein [Vicinamibacteria bacterium]
MRAKILILSTAIGLLAAPSARAQAQATPAFDLGLAYSFLQDKQLDEKFTYGGLVSLGITMSQGSSLVAEVSYHQKDLLVAPDQTSGTGSEATVKTSFGSLMGGFRFWGKGKSRLYLQVLAGGARTRLEAGPADVTSETKFALQPGAGLDLRVSSSLALRAGGDYRIIYAEEHLKQWRGYAGIALYFGQR